MVSFTTDPSKELDLYFRINKDGGLDFSFLDSGGNAYLISSFTFIANFKIRHNDSSNILQLTEGSGLTKNSSDLILTLTKTQSNLFREQSYYWELVRTISGLEKVWFNGNANFHNGIFDGLSSTSEIITIDESGSPITISIFDSFDNGLINGTYSTILNFNIDQDIYHDATGVSITFTLGSNNNNGKGIILRLNKPIAVTFPGTFEADAGSAALDATKLNVYILIFFTNWNGSGLDHVIYKNSLYTAL